MVRRTKADAQTTRNNLLDAAEQLFQARGVSRTSLNDIATAAGATRGAIYWHFKDKADLFNAMLERVTLPLEQALEQAILEQSDDPVTDTRQAMLESLRLIATDAQTRRVLQIATQQIEYTAELGAVLERHQRSHREWVGRNLQALERSFALRQIKPTVALTHASLGLQALLEGLVQHWLLDPAAFDLLAVGRTSLDVFFAGLGLHPLPAASRLSRLAATGRRRL